jgi:hypothetical protein
MEWYAARWSFKGAKIQILLHPDIFFIFVFRAMQNDLLITGKINPIPASQEVQGPAPALSGRG